MSIDLDIPEHSKLVSRHFRLPQTLCDELDLYLEAATLKYPTRKLDVSLILEALLRKQLERDKHFHTFKLKRESVATEPSLHPQNVQTKAKHPKSMTTKPEEERSTASDGAVPPASHHPVKGENP